MLYALIAGTLHHAAHLPEALALLGVGARGVESDPLYRARILLMAQHSDVSLLERQFRRHGAFPRTLADPDGLSGAVREWRPQLLIYIDWEHSEGERLRHWHGDQEVDSLSILAVGPEGDHQAMSALDAGVDAYLSAPLSETLVLAQAAALLRHGHGWEQVLVDLPGRLQIDPRSHRVWVQGQELQLSRRIFRLFHYLAQHAEQTFTATEIAQHLGNGQKFVQENTVAAQVHRLRKALETVNAQDWLETVHGFGYRLSVPPAEQQKSA